MSTIKQTKCTAEDGREFTLMGSKDFYAGILAARAEELMMELARYEAKVEQYEIDISQRITNTFDRDEITRIVRKATEMHSSAEHLGLHDIHRFEALLRRAGALRRFKMGVC